MQYDLTKSSDVNSLTTFVIFLTILAVYHALYVKGQKRLKVPYNS